MTFDCRLLDFLSLSVIEDTVDFCITYGVSFLRVKRTGSKTVGFSWGNYNMDGCTQDSLHLFNIMFPAITGLLGVLLGGFITSQNAKKERLNRRHKEQLDFYGAMLGMQQKIRAKSETRLKLRNIERKQRDTSGLEAQMKYDNEQLTQELVPLYGAMLDLWTKNIALAEPSTQLSYPIFVEYVEIWNRGLAKAMGSETIFEVEHDETKLHPFYEDLKKQVERLQALLSK